MELVDDVVEVALWSAGAAAAGAEAVVFWSGVVLVAAADWSAGAAAGALAEEFMSVLLVELAVVDVEALPVEVAPLASAAGAVAPSGTAVDESAVMAAGVWLLLELVLEAVELSDFVHLSEIIWTLVTLKLSPLIEPVNWTSWPLCAPRSEVLPVSL